MKKEIGGLVFYDTFFEAQTDRLKAWVGNNPAAFPLSFYGGELLGEIGEVANVIKKLEREAGGVPGSRATKEMLASELGDVMICSGNLAIKLGGDLDGGGLLPYAIGKEVEALSEYCLAMGRVYGELAGHLLFPTEYNGQQSIKLLRQIGWLATQIAEQTDIELHTATAEKWNQTSNTNGFPHRIILPGMAAWDQFHETPSSEPDHADDLSRLESEGGPPAKERGIPLEETFDTDLKNGNI